MGADRRHALDLREPCACWNCGAYLAWGRAVCLDCLRVFLIGAATALGTQVIRSLW